MDATLDTLFRATPQELLEAFIFFVGLGVVSFAILSGLISTFYLTFYEAAESLFESLHRTTTKGRNYNG